MKSSEAILIGAIDPLFDSKSNGLHLKIFTMLLPVFRAQENLNVLSCGLDVILIRSVMQNSIEFLISKLHEMIFNA